MNGNSETILGSIFGLGFAAMTNAVEFMQATLLNVTKISLSTFLITCISTIFFGALGAFGGWLFKYIRLELKKFITRKRQ